VTTHDTLRIALEIHYEVLAMRLMTIKDEHPDKSAIQAQMAFHPASPSAKPLTKERVASLAKGHKLTVAIEATVMSLQRLHGQSQRATGEHGRSSRSTAKQTRGATAKMLAGAVAATKMSLSGATEYRTLHFD
jgi:hypothetical protein